MQFEERKSSSGEYYYKNLFTGKTQWGSRYFSGTKIPLPKGLVCLISNNKEVYKHIGDRKKNARVTSHSYAPQPDSEEWQTVSRKKDKPKKEKEKEKETKDYTIEPKKITEETYSNLKLLKTQPAKDEINRRVELFEEVASRLNCKTESIIDESLQYLASQASVLPQTIIEYIKKTEHKQLGENASLTAFHIISQTDPSYLSERSIRELCGLDMRHEELSSAAIQLRDLVSEITGELIQYPVMCGCSFGHTYDKTEIAKWFLQNRTCPMSREKITGNFIPNVFAKKILDAFAEKYGKQRGEIWNEIKNICIEYINVNELRLKEEKQIRDELRLKEERRKITQTTYIAPNHTASPRPFSERRTHAEPPRAPPPRAPPPPRGAPRDRSHRARPIAPFGNGTSAREDQTRDGEPHIAPFTLRHNTRAAQEAEAEQTDHRIATPQFASHPLVWTGSWGGYQRWQPGGYQNWQPFG
jgi:hypothetical protein